MLSNEDSAFLLKLKNCREFVQSQLGDARKEKWACYLYCLSLVLAYLPENQQLAASHKNWDYDSTDEWGRIPNQSNEIAAKQAAKLPANADINYSVLLDCLCEIIKGYLMSFL